MYMYINDFRILEIKKKCLNYEVYLCFRTCMRGTYINSTKIVAVILYMLGLSYIFTIYSYMNVTYSTSFLAKYPGPLRKFVCLRVWLFNKLFN